jgi:RNA polymerase sigma-70 factor (ECF subfamily)
MNSTNIAMPEDSPNSAWATRLTLLQRARNPDDQAAWEEFVSYYRQFIVIVVRHMNIPAADCDDVVQSVLVKIWKNLPKFEVDTNRAQFRTWLTTVIRNTVYNYVDKAQRRQARHDRLAEEETTLAQLPGGGKETELEAFINREWETYIANLAMENIKPLFSERAIQAFSLSLDGLSMSEISSRLEIKENSCYKLRNRVKARLITEVRRLTEELEL